MIPDTIYKLYLVSEICESQRNVNDENEELRIKICLAQVKSMATKTSFLASQPTRARGRGRTYYKKRFGSNRVDFFTLTKLYLLIK